MFPRSFRDFFFEMRGWEVALATRVQCRFYNSDSHPCSFTNLAVQDATKQGMTKYQHNLLATMPDL